MTAVHIYRARPQPATKFVVPVTDEQSLTIVHSPGQLLLAHCCKRRRRARNLEAQAYYDGNYYFCVDGKGCKA